MPYGTVNADVIQSSVSGVSLGAGNASIMKNRIINGAMVIDQRNAGASVTPANAAYTLDRWAANMFVNTGKFTVQQNAGSITPPAGFANYLGVTSSSAYSIGSSDIYTIFQAIEGYNTADLGWGTANAKTITLSFWVRSSLTGTFGGVLQNSANDRTYPFTFTISSANTWEQKSITVVGDTTGTWATTNGAGIILRFGLGVGSTYSGTAGSWAGAAYYSATGATSVVGTNGATFYITGVQLEVGSSATGYEYRQYGQELALCQRYYEKSFNTGTAPANGVAATDRNQLTAWNASYQSYQTVFKVEKRTGPTMTFYRSASGSSDGVWAYWNSGWNNFSSIAGTAVLTSEFMVDLQGSGFTVNASYIGAGHWTASAEL